MRNEIRQNNKRFEDKIKKYPSFHRNCEFIGRFAILKIKEKADPEYHLPNKCGRLILIFDSEFLHSTFIAQKLVGQ